MIINITNKTTINDVQRKMRATYPFLKIEFCRKPGLKDVKTRKHWYDHEVKLLAIAKKAEPGWVVINFWQKSGDIKHVFESRFGLYPGIFRRRVDEWIEISGTDVFTLEEQNEISRMSVEKNHAPSWRERELLL